MFLHNGSNKSMGMLIKMSFKTFAKNVVLSWAGVLESSFKAWATFIIDSWKWSENLWLRAPFYSIIPIFLEYFSKCLVAKFKF